MTSLEPKAPPDGELHAWLVVAGGFSALVCTFGYLNSSRYESFYHHLHPLMSAFEIEGQFS